MTAFSAHKQLLLRLWLTPGAGPVFVQKLFNAAFLQGSSFDPTDFQHLCPQQLSQITRIAASEISRIQNALVSIDALEKEMLRVQKAKAAIVTILDTDYPDLLSQIYAPPIALIYLGTLPKHLSTSIAIVGSRDASTYASSSLNILLPELISAGFTTVSGGAVGVDSMVHQKTLELGGTTIAVLGSGLNRVYPPGNQLLFKKIVAQGGAIISPFSMEQHANKSTFPARNRIISGLSSACLVIQAAAKSGALITASFALEQNREVLTVPGPIDNPYFIGNNKLLKQGAAIVTESKDIFNALNIAYPENATNIPPTEKNSNIFAGILNFMQAPIGIEELMLESGLEFEVLQEMLFDLQLEQKAQQHLNGTWQRT